MNCAWKPCFLSWIVTVKPCLCSKCACDRSYVHTWLPSSQHSGCYVVFLSVLGLLHLSIDWEGIFNLKGEETCVPTLHPFIGASQKSTHHKSSSQLPATPSTSRSISHRDNIHLKWLCKKDIKDIELWRQAEVVNISVLLAWYLCDIGCHLTSIF